MNVNVYGNMPHMLKGICRFHISLFMSNTVNSGINIFTLKPFDMTVILLDHIKIPRQKGRATPSDRSIESKIRANPRRALQNNIILRSERSGSGSIRDASKTSGRQNPRDRDHQNLQYQSTYFLSDSQPIREEGDTRSCSSKTRTERTTSMHIRNYSVCTSADGRVTISNNERYPSGNFRKFWYNDTSPNFRTRSQQSWKRGATNSSSVTLNYQPETVFHYESLREAALHPDTPNPVVGIGLFILRGMIGWLEALPAIVSEVSWDVDFPDYSRRIGMVGQSEFVKILANIIISSRRCS